MVSCGLPLVLVNVQTSELAAAVAAAFRTIVAVVAVAAGLKLTLAEPVPVHEPAVASQPAGIVSVRVVVVSAVVRVIIAPLAAVAAAVVLIVSVPKPLLPLNENVPTPPLVIFAI